MSTDARRKVYTVSRLNQEVLLLLESNFGTLWLEAEISNFSKPASGHYYFTLKDSRAQIRCAMFKGRNRYVDFKPGNGDAVLVRGKLGLYAARGDFQLIVEHMEPAGAGRLQAAFEATRARLDDLGWFSMKHKKSLPAMPQSIGIVTSPTGAAVRDVVQVLSRRYPQARLIVYPTVTQGAQAAPEIARALHTAARRDECDVLLLVRGGGSLEDLWGFNEVVVAEAMRACHLPIVSGVGHEVDVTIADLVADLRAPTPSAAAELATPDGLALRQRAQQAGMALKAAFSRRLKLETSQLTTLHARLEARHPRRLLTDRQQRVDELDTRLRGATIRRLANARQRLDTQERTLRANGPARFITPAATRLATVNMRLETASRSRIKEARHRFAMLARALDSVSPLAVLERGFAVVSQNGNPVGSVHSLKTGDRVRTRLADGTFDATVTGLKATLAPGNTATDSSKKTPQDGAKTARN